MTVVAGRRAGRWLLCRPSRATMGVVQRELADLFATHGLVPRQVQTDRGSCLLGADGAGTTALPGRLTLWLAGLRVGHGLIPVRRPQHNGAVERFHSGVEHSWQGEDDGLSALMAVWHVTRPPLSDGHLSHAGRAGVDLDRVWELLGQARVPRRVNRQGKLSLWDRSVWVGTRATGQTVTVAFDPGSRQVVIRDEHEHLLRTVALPWLTAEWLWAPIPLSHHVAHRHDPSTFG